MELRRVNRFSGTNLSLAPAHLVVPLNADRNLNSIKLQDTNSNEYKLQLVLAEYPHLPHMERKAYLEMNDWDVEATLKEIENDAAWEKDQKGVETVQMKVTKKLTAQPESNLKTNNTSVQVDEVSSLLTPLLMSVKPFEVE
jgi:hypothetical protein